MMEDPATGSLIPFEFAHIYDQVPELKRFNLSLDFVSFDEPIDSSEITIASWQRIAELVEINYSHYDGFVILHGTDTMAYSASALSFMLENLAKPVIFTGSQLPMGKLRTDGKENLITAIEIAAAKRNNEPVVQEVAVYFESKLMRGNRTHKYSTENFDAFESANFPTLADVGIHIFYKHHLMFPARPADGRSSQTEFKVNSRMDENVAILKFFPGISKRVVESVLNVNGLKGVVLETFGAGNAPRSKWLIDALAKAVSKAIVVVNVSQCNKGFVEQGLYDTSKELWRIGVIGGADMTTESTLAKMMFLLGLGLELSETKRMMMTSMRGELTSFSNLE